MTWLQLRLDISPEEASDLESRLLASGAVAVTLQDSGNQPVLEPSVGATPLWDSIRLTGLYPADADLMDVLTRLPPHLQAPTRHRVEILEDREWEREWMAHYRPMQFGQRLWVCPSW
ncbi:MAG: 50S ribosomal protein L11 methyltransferase, partial [Halioglobus sp.]|nr:50S ribosomal protein L11 methyltransferase [Halioglobus sp.]